MMPNQEKDENGPGGEEDGDGTEQGHNTMFRVFFQPIKAKYRYVREAGKKVLFLVARPLRPSLPPLELSDNWNFK